MRLGSEHGGPGGLRLCFEWHPRGILSLTASDVALAGSLVEPSRLAISNVAQAVVKAESMSAGQRIYLDNAATSWPKAPAVIEAVTTYLRDNGAPAGRGTYTESLEVDRRLQALRCDLARLLDAPDPRRVIFCFNGSDALNLALHGLLQPGDHVVATRAEHNSVLRPLAWLAEHRGVHVDYADCDGVGRVDLDQFRRLLRPGQTRLAAVVHASNVTGAVQPIAEMAALARAAGAEFLLDAAQTLGQWPVSVRELPVSLLAAPGHKSLGGPLGTGLLYIAPELEDRLEPLRQGGTGTRSEDERQPRELPERYEAGNHNVPGLFGLAAAVAPLTGGGIAQVRKHHGELTRRAREGLARVRGVRIFVPNDVADQVGVLSFVMEGWEPQEAATALDQAFHLQLRAGFHCAPGVHRALGTLDSGGTLRLSWGRDTTEEMVDTAVAAIAEIAASV